MDNKTLLTSKNLYNHLIKDFLPIAITTTILAPIERLKLILQTINLMSIQDKNLNINILSKKIIKEQGIFSLWRGNNANIYRLFISSYSNILIFKQIKKEYGKITSSFISSSIGLLLSYPYDLAKTRMSGDMTRWGNKRIYTSIPDLFNKIMHEQNFTRFNISKLHRGLSIDIMSNFIYWFFSFNLYEYLMNSIYKDNSSFYKKTFDIFSSTSLNAILVSIVIYPLDTFKRHIQVNNGFGYLQYYRNYPHAIQEFIKLSIKDKYRGFSLHILKIIPFSFIHFTMYQSLNKNFMID